MIGCTIEPKTDQMLEKKNSFGIQVPQSFTKDKEYHHRWNNSQKNPQILSVLINHFRLYYFVAKDDEERKGWMNILIRYCLDDNLRPVLFYDRLSGLSRSILLFCNINHILVGSRSVPLRLEPKTVSKEFLDLSPDRLVPILNIKSESKTMTNL